MTLLKAYLMGVDNPFILLKHYFNEIAKRVTIGDYANQLRNNINYFEGDITNEEINELEEALDRLLENYPELALKEPKVEAMPSLKELNAWTKRWNKLNSTKTEENPNPLLIRHPEKKKKPVTQTNYNKAKKDWAKNQQTPTKNTLFTDSKRLNSLRQFQKLLETKHEGIQLSKIKGMIDKFIEKETERLKEVRPQKVTGGVKLQQTKGKSKVKSHKKRLIDFKDKLVKIRTALAKKNILDYKGKLIYSKELEDRISEIIDSPDNLDLFEKVNLGKKISLDSKIKEAHEDVYNYLQRTIKFPDRYGKPIEKKLGDAIMYIVEQQTNVVRADLSHRPILIERLLELQSKDKNELMALLEEPRYADRSQEEWEKRQPVKEEEEEEDVEEDAAVLDRLDIIERLIQQGEGTVTLGDLGKEPERNDEEE